MSAEAVQPRLYTFLRRRDFVGLIQRTIQKANGKTRKRFPSLSTIARANRINAIRKKRKQAEKREKQKFMQDIGAEAIR